MTRLLTEAHRPCFSIPRAYPQSSIALKGASLRTTNCNSQTERNIVRQMPNNTYMGHLQRNYPELFTESGAINGALLPYACEVVRITTDVLRRDMPELR